MLDGKWTDETRPKALYQRYVAQSPSDYASLIVEGLGHDEQRVRSGCAELMSLLAEEYPEVAYPHVDLIVENLASKQPILRWEAACSLGHLLRIDRENKIPPHRQALYDFLPNKSVVLQGYAVRALANMARAFPQHAPEIQEKLLASLPHFPDKRVGYLVEAMEPFLAMPELAETALAFVNDYASSPIRSLATKARRVLKRAGV